MEDNKPQTPGHLIPNELPNNPIWSKIIITCVFSLLAGAFFFAVFIFAGQSPDFLTDGQCNDLIANSTNESLIIGYEFGYNIAVKEVFDGVRECKQILPIMFNNQTFNVVAVECLNLNNEGGNK